MLEHSIAQWEKEYIQKGMVLGKAEGIATQKSTLLDMLSDRFGVIPPSWKVAIDQINEPTILSKLTQAILQAILKVKSQEEYAEELKGATKTQ